MRTPERRGRPTPTTAWSRSAATCTGPRPSTPRGRARSPAGCGPTLPPPQRLRTLPPPARPPSPARSRWERTLTADTSGIADEDGLADTSFSYQWIAGGTDIQGATGSSYTLAESDEGKAIRVRVNFTDDAGNEETLTSAATDAVAARPNSVATGQPTINGTARVGETLTVDTSGITDEDGLDNATFSYQWIAGGTDIQGATDSSYTLTVHEKGLTIRVWVAFTDDSGNEEAMTSAATAAVAAAPTPLTAEFRDTPGSHDGQAAFTFELRFSEQFSLGFKKAAGPRLHRERG